MRVIPNDFQAGTVRRAFSRDLFVLVKLLLLALWNIDQRASDFELLMIGEDKQ